MGLRFLSAVLALAFGAMLTFVNHDLHLRFVPRILIHRLVAKFSKNNFVKKFQNSCTSVAAEAVLRSNTRFAWCGTLNADSSAAPGFFENPIHSSKPYFPTTNLPIP